MGTAATATSDTLTREEKEKLALALLEKQRRANRKASRKDVNAFCEFVLQDHEKKVPIQQGKVHIELQRWITSHRLGAMLLPRGHGKTEQVIGRVLWELGNNPDLRIKIVCNSDDEASKRIQALSEHIERNPAVHDVFPDLRPSDKQDWTKHTLRVQRTIISKDPSIEACGVLSTGTGARADLIIFDDVVDLRNAIQLTALRKAVKQAFRAVWLNLLSPRGRAVYIATPWHHDDLTSELRADPEWGPHFMVRSVDEAYTPVWSEMWPVEALKQKEKEIGTREFARAFKLLPLSDDEATFPIAVIGTGPENPGLVRDYSLAVADVRLDLPRFTGFDLAISKQDTADFTVAYTIAYDSSRNIAYPIEIIRGRFTPTETGNLIINAWKKHNSQLLIVENNAYQGAILDILALIPGAPTGLPLVPFRTGMQKADPSIGLPGLVACMENGGWKFPLRGHDRLCGCSLCTALKELQEYPLGVHDDTIMAGWFVFASLAFWRQQSMDLPVVHYTPEGEAAGEMEEVVIGSLVGWK
jgi:hypothetical protein